jgi:hypothetical protein
MYLGKEQATGWRDEVKHVILNWSRREYQQGVLNSSFFNFNVLDPCNRWYDKGVQLDDVGGYVVQMDKMEIAKSDVVIVNATNPGWGTPMEQYIAWMTGKMVLAFSDCEYPSIWAKVHSNQFFRTHIEAAEFLCSIAHNIARVI